MHRDKPDQFHLRGAGIDLDFGKVRHHHLACFVELNPLGCAAYHFGRGQVLVNRRAHQLLEGNAAFLAALDKDPAVFDVEVCGVGFQVFGCKLQNLLFGMLGGGFGGPRHHVHAITAKSHHGVPADFRITVDDVDIFQFDAQHFCGHHGLCRIATLPHASDTRGQCHGAIGIDLDGDTVKTEECKSTDMSGDTHTHAAQFMPLDRRWLTPALPFLLPADGFGAPGNTFGQSGTGQFDLRVFIE